MITLKKLSENKANDKVFKEKFISYLNKEHRCTYCKGIKKITNFEIYNIKFLYVRGCIRWKLNNKLVNLPSPLHPDYKILKRYYALQFKCKCRKNRYFFRMNNFKNG